VREATVLRAAVGTKRLPALSARGPRPELRIDAELEVVVLAGEAVHLVPESAPWAADEFLDRGRHEHGGAASCLDCRREIVASEISITLTSLPDRFCPWCARPR